VVFEKEYIMRCSSAEGIARNEMMPSWCRQVNWGNCGIPWVNCAVLCVKDDRKGQCWGLRYWLLKLRSLLFLRQVWSHTIKSPLRIRITEISRFRCGAIEIFILLGCYVVRVCSYFPTFLNNLSVSSPRLKQYKNTCWSDRFLEMGPTGCTETSVTTNLRRLTF
jgi:hypothetical protein